MNFFSCFHVELCLSKSNLKDPQKISQTLRLAIWGHLGHLVLLLGADEEVGWDREGGSFSNAVTKLHITSIIKKSAFLVHSLQDNNMT